LGTSLALIAHLLGTIVAAFLIYFISPYFADFIEADLVFVYWVLYSLLVVWSIREAKDIELGKNKNTQKLNELFDEDDNK
jgi:hypothetical protein